MHRAKPIHEMHLSIFQDFELNLVQANNSNQTGCVLKTEQIFKITIPCKLWPTVKINSKRMRYGLISETKRMTQHPNMIIYPNINMNKKQCSNFEVKGFPAPAHSCVRLVQQVTTSDCRT